MKFAVSDKARKIIREGKIHIRKRDITYEKIKATIEGSHDTYHTEIFRDGRFNCGCEAFIYTKKRGVECSHILAIKMHPVYRDWYPCKLTDGGIFVDKRLRRSMPIYRLMPKDLDDNPHIDEGLVNIIESSDKDETEKFILWKRWIERESYNDIVESVKNELNIEVSKGEVKRISKEDPREWGD